MFLDLTLQLHSTVKNCGDENLQLCRCDCLFIYNQMKPPWAGMPGSSSLCCQGRKYLILMLPFFNQVCTNRSVMIVAFWKQHICAQDWSLPAVCLIPSRSSWKHLCEQTVVSYSLYSSCSLCFTCPAAFLLLIISTLDTDILLTVWTSVWFSCSCQLLTHLNCECQHQFHSSSRSLLRKAKKKRKKRNKERLLPVHTCEIFQVFCWWSWSK